MNRRLATLDCSLSAVCSRWLKFVLTLFTVSVDDTFQCLQCFDVYKNRMGDDLRPVRWGASDICVVMATLLGIDRTGFRL